MACSSRGSLERVGASSSRLTSLCLAAVAGCGGAFEEPELADAQVLWELELESETSQAFPRTEGLAVATSEYGEIFAVSVARDPAGQDDRLVLVALSAEGELLWRDERSVSGRIADAELAVRDDEIACALAIEGGVLFGHHEVRVYDTVDGSSQWVIPGRSQTFGGQRVGIAWRGEDLVVTGSADRRSEHVGASRSIVVEGYAWGETSPSWSWIPREDSEGMTGDDVAVGADGRIFVAGEHSGQPWVGHLSARGELVWEARVDLEPSWSRTWISLDEEDRLFVVRDERVFAFDLEGRSIPEHELTALAPNSRLVWAGPQFALAGDASSWGRFKVFAGDGTLAAEFAPGDADGLHFARAVAWHPDGGLAVLGDTLYEGEERRASLARIGDEV